MRNLILALLLIAAVAIAAMEYRSISKPVPAYRAFVGSWRLVSSVEVLPDGNPRPYGFGPHAQGYLMYDATGHVCAQVADPDRPRWADPEHPTPAELAAAYNGFGGYCGTYTVNEKTHTAAHIPEVSLNPNLVNQPQPRSYRFENDNLIYYGIEKLETGGESHWTMTWERLK
jgi:hypothetical protein